RAHPDDEIFVLLIGHGSFDSRGGMFNLPGPDLTADDYAKLLAKWPTQHVVFVNTASASGAFLPAVAAPGRTVVTATKTGGEKNETRFATYFVEAYETEAADRDRNGRVSVLEAFDYAKAKVVKAFEQEGTLLTEHATLDDGSEGKVAATMFLAPAEGRASSTLDMTNPAIRDLVRERDALEQQIAGLKLRKADMDPAQYEQELEKLLLALAEKSRALQLAGKKQ
ncbi:MAG TPA: C13 family peptidase, partial [Vicinamibacterales bacterium]|nr:C13 family peptidase [Vicinamibacterales bacterium]